MLDSFDHLVVDPVGFHFVSRSNGVNGEGQRGRGRARVRH